MTGADVCNPVKLQVTLLQLSELSAMLVSQVENDHLKPTRARSLVVSCSSNWPSQIAFSGALQNFSVS